MVPKDIVYVGIGDNIILNCQVTYLFSLHTIIWGLWNKPIQFNVGTSYPVTITKIQDASSNGDLELFNVNYKNIDYTREEGQQLSVGGATFYIGSVYLDNVTHSCLPIISRQKLRIFFKY